MTEGRPVWFESAGTRLYARVRGSGVPLVLLHGSALSTHAVFDELAERLADTYRVVACDVRGFGRSVSRGPDTHTWDQYVADVLALLDHLALPNAVIGGQSFGSAVAIATALRHPARVRGLVVAQPGYAGAEIGQTELQRPGWAESQRLVEAVAEHGLLDTMLTTQTDEAGRQRVREAVGDQHEPSFVAAHRGQMQTAQPFERLTELDSITAPVLLVPGTDGFHDPLISALYAEHLPRVFDAATAAFDPVTWADDLLSFAPLVG